jgi:hypothetical protein
MNKELIKQAKHELEVYKYVKPETANKLIEALESKERVFVVNEKEKLS